MDDLGDSGAMGVPAACRNRWDRLRRSAAPYPEASSQGCTEDLTNQCRRVMLPATASQVPGLGPSDVEWRRNYKFLLALVLSISALTLVARGDKGDDTAEDTAAAE